MERLCVERHKPKDGQSKNKITFGYTGHGDEFVDGEEGNDC